MCPKVTQKANIYLQDLLYLILSRDVFLEKPEKSSNIQASFAKNLLPRTFKNRPVWSHWLNETDTNFQWKRQLVKTLKYIFLGRQPTLGFIVYLLGSEWTWEVARIFFTSAVNIIQI